MEEAPTVDATGLARPELNFSSGVVGNRVEGLCPPGAGEVGEGMMQI